MEDNLANIAKKENIVNLDPIKIDDNNNIYFLNISIT